MVNGCSLSSDPIRTNNGCSLVHSAVGELIMDIDLEIVSLSVDVRPRMLAQVMLQYLVSRDNGARELIVRQNCHTFETIWANPAIGYGQLRYGT